VELMELSTNSAASNPLTIHIVQPALPAYRIPFFRELQRELSKRNEVLRVYASTRDFLNVESAAPEGFDARLNSTWSVHMGGRAFWQRDLNVPLARGDVLVINGNLRLLSNYPLWARAKWSGIPVVWWGQGWSAGSHGRRAKFRQRIMRIADAVLLYTDTERDDYVSLGFAPDRTFALNNGLDIRSIDRAIAGWDAARLHAFRNANRLDAFAHWCIFVGRLSRKSGIGLLVESLPAIREDVGLIILGDGPIAEETRQSARALGVSSRIVWVGAQFDEDIVAPWMLSAGVSVYPGAVGLSLIHGFAYGLPAVVHGDKRQQMPEFAAFEGNGNGFSFECGSAGSLAFKINEIFEDTAHREAMSRRAKALVHRTFNVEDMTRRFIEVIDRLRFSREV
jgi:glycosyltransferase involved in cell wall biosynthesis